MSPYIAAPWILWVTENGTIGMIILGPLAATIRQKQASHHEISHRKWLKNDWNRKSHDIPIS